MVTLGGSFHKLDLSIGLGVAPVLFSGSGSGMGRMRVETTGPEGTAEHEEPFQDYYLSLRSFFNVRRCMWCVDHFAELGDICFGDLHVGKYIGTEKGISSIVARSSEMDEILRKMEKEDIVSLEELPITDLLDSQQFVKTKKHINPAYMQIDRALGRNIPEYDLAFSPVQTIKALKSYIIKTAQMFVGRHKSLHRLIRLGRKNMRGWK